MNHKQFETVLKRLDTWAKRARKWKTTCRTLDDTLAASRLQRDLERARNLLRPHIFAFENMCAEQTECTKS